MAAASDAAASDGEASDAAGKLDDAPLVASDREPRPAPAIACSWSRRSCAYPHLVVGIDAGVSHLVEHGLFGFDVGVGSVTDTGPTWGVRAGAEFTTWLAIEAHYIGIANAVDASVNSGVVRHFLTTAVVAELRLTAPLTYVQPYLFFGGGIYSTSLTGSSPATEMYGSTEFGLPIGVGFGVPLSRGISVGTEATYHRLFGESFSDNEDIGGGDPIDATAVLRFRF